MTNDKVILERTDEGYAVSFPGLTGRRSHVETEAEALPNISDAIADYLAVVEDLTRGKTVRQVEVAA